MIMTKVQRPAVSTMNHLKIGTEKGNLDPNFPVNLDIPRYFSYSFDIIFTLSKKRSGGSRKAVTLTSVLSR